MSLPPRAKRLVALGTRFLTVGAISTVIEIAVFNLLLVGFGWDAVSAKVVASLVALVNAYFGNRQWTFRHRARRRRWLEVALFVGVNAICTVLGAVIVWLGVDAAAALLERQPGALVVNVINLASIVVVVIARFGFYHGVVFRVAPQKSAATEPRTPAPRS
ncbi:GtrA family protein [Microbacterium jiangjiandongii]|uniref:GtrA family protein n=1 Tax=Microbacterium jiangjiandongii TaxID=3049071 RepID=UPI00214B358D|nr:GtrA family protein [Microbacterium sp. zg.Y843]MCR2815867.1 GtrA family protein [Microbacterium sp. zg.Y843]